MIGAPIYYLELALGQFSSRGPATAFILAKGWQGKYLNNIFKEKILRNILIEGVGFAMIINSVLCMLYYNVIISWALFYFISSFRTNLLWKKCGYWWNDERCFVPGAQNSLYTENGTTYNCTELQFMNFTEYSCAQTNRTDRVTATEQFF